MSATPARPWPTLAVAFCLLIAVLGQLPHLRDDAWEDEAATLMMFAAGSPADAFRDYRMPNNHMLFSAALASWWSRGESVERARLLPAVTWLASMALMAWSGIRVLGAPATAIALGLWSGAALTAAFAVALRGYAFSWPWVLLLFAAAPRWVSSGARLAAVTCALAGAAAMLTLPTNGIALACCHGFALWQDREHHGHLRPVAWLRAAATIGLGLLGGLAYVAHRADLAAYLRMGFSTWTTTQIMAHWWLASSAQWLPLLPLALWGAARAVQAPHGDVSRRALRLLAVLCVLPAVAVALSPVPLVPRALVPLLPMWGLAFGGLLASTVPALAGGDARRRAAVCAALTLAGFACGHVVPACAGAPWRFPRGDDLCHSMLREDYRPALLLDAIATRHPGVPVLVPTSELFALSFLQWNGTGTAARLFDRGTWAAQHDLPTPSLVVATTAEEVHDLLRGLAPTPPPQVEEELRAGRYALWRCLWP